MMKKNTDELKPLKISCTSTDCASNLHCFRFHKRKMAADQRGACRDCGAKLIDWGRVHKRDLSDIDYTFNSLKYEFIRHHNWHVKIDLRAINYARRKGKSQLRDVAVKRIRKYLKPNNPWDGRQTPYKQNPIYYGQHATASCCRKCMEYWHNIPQNRNLTEAEIQYFADLIMAYICDRLPNLTEGGEKVPPIRTK